MKASSLGWWLWAVGGVLLVVGWLANVSVHLGWVGFATCIGAAFVRSKRTSAPTTLGIDKVPDQDVKDNDV